MGCTVVGDVCGLLSVATVGGRLLGSACMRRQGWCVVLGAVARDEPQEEHDLRLSRGGSISARCEGLVDVGEMWRRQLPRQGLGTCSLL